MKKYIYRGHNKVFLRGYGSVTPGETLEVNFEIRNSFFHEIKEPKVVKTKKEKEQDG
jgi:hypothetical protein